MAMTSGVVLILLEQHQVGLVTGLPIMEKQGSYRSWNSKFASFGPGKSWNQASVMASYGK